MPRTKFAPVYSFGSISGQNLDCIKQNIQFINDSDDKLAKARELALKKREEKKLKELEEKRKEEEIRKQLIEQRKEEQKLIEKETKLRNWKEFVTNNKFIIVECRMYTTDHKYQGAPICGVRYRAENNSSSRVQQKLKDVFFSSYPGNEVPAVFYNYNPRLCPVCCCRLSKKFIRNGDRICYPENLSQEEIEKGDILPHVKFQSRQDTKKEIQFRRELGVLSNIDYANIEMYSDADGVSYVVQ